jgi:hypothetical protein
MQQRGLRVSVIASRPSFPTLLAELGDALVATLARKTQID